MRSTTICLTIHPCAGALVDNLFPAVNKMTQVGKRESKGLWKEPARIYQSLVDIWAETFAVERASPETSRAASDMIMLRKL